MPINLDLGRLREEDSELRTEPGCIVGPHMNNQKHIIQRVKLVKT